jgi:hypothetical protein
LGLGDLPVGGCPTREVIARERDEFGTAGLTGQEDFLLACDQIVYEIGHWTFNHRRRHGGTSALSVD